MIYTKGMKDDIDAWRTSSYSKANGNCLEAGQGRDAIGLRDTNDPDGPVLTFSAGTWRAFIARLKVP
jgi:Domain of unknown function (DUF397)